MPYRMGEARQLENPSATSSPTVDQLKERFQRLEVLNPPVQAAAVMPPGPAAMPAAASAVPATPPMAPPALPADPAAAIPAATPAMAVLLVQAPLLGQGEHPLPPLAIKFNGSPKQLAHFLTQVWHYIERYEVEYPGDANCIDCVALMLDGDVAECLMALHDDTAKLRHFDTFMWA